MAKFHENNRLYISNLHFEVTKDDLLDYLEGQGLGVVQVWVPKDKNYTDRWKNRGFAFAEFIDDQEAEEALEIISDAPGPGDRALTASIAEPRIPSWLK